MPEYSEEVRAKIAALVGLPAAERRYAEPRAIYWPSGVKVYAPDYSAMPGWGDFAAGLSAALADQLGYADPVVASLIIEKSTPFADLPRTASIAEDGVDSAFSDLDGAISELVVTHGEGVPLEVFGYWSATPDAGTPFDLLLSLWRGMTKAPKEMTRSRLTLPASTGFRSPNMDVPRRPHATSCTFHFGGLFATQAEVDYHKACPHNANLTDEERNGAPKIGVPGVFDCPRAVVGDCLARMTLPDTETQTARYWPGFDVRSDPIPNYVRGRNMAASAVGNASNLSGAVRVIIGERLVKSLPLLAYRNEVNTAHADKGFGAGLFEVSEGPVAALWNFYMNGVFVGLEHQNLRFGEYGQPATFFSPGISSFSGTAHAFGRIQGNFNDNQAASLTASIMCRGLRDIRVYSDPNTYTKQYTQKRMWAILEALANPVWGYGNDYARYDIQSAVDCASWHDENVSMHDPNGNLFTGPRSTCNVELNSRSVQQQLNDLCVAGRVGLPFEFNGLDTFVPLKEEDLSDPSSVPTFTDEGPDRNIIYDGPNSSLSWAYTSDTELINQWTINFDDGSNGYAETQLIFGDQRAQLRAGRAAGDRSIKVNNKQQPAFGITNFSEAARFGVYTLYLGPLDSGGVANPWEVKFTTWYSDALFVQMYKPIRVLNSKLQARILDYYAARADSFPWWAGQTYRYFRVKKMTRKGNLRVEITAQLYPEDFYAEIEDVSTPPPLFVAPPSPNPGGRRDEQPEPIGFRTLALSGDRVLGQLEMSAY